MATTVNAQSDRPWEPDPIRFVDSPFPPYVIGEIDGGEVDGIAPAIAREAAARIGRSITIELHPWSRVLRILEAGAADGVLLVMWSADRERYLQHLPAVFEAREIVFYNTEQAPGFIWQSYADLIPYQIGLVDDYTYGEEFLNAVRDFPLKVEYAASSEENLRKLAAGRVDLVVEEELVGEYLVAALNAGSSIGTADRTITAYEYHFAFSRSGAGMEVLNAFSRAIIEMRSDGSIDRIVESFLQ